ncbi:MAG: S9 family peptidase [Gemmatimonadota bacterium]
MKAFPLMPRHRSRGLGAALLALILATPALASAQQKPLDHDAYDRWKSIRGERISGDGDWVLYELAPRTGDGELVVVTRRGTREQRVERATGARFVPGTDHVVFTIRPAHDSVRVLRLAETKRADMPGDTLGILDLGTGQVTRVPDVRSWRVAEAGAIVAYLHEAETSDEPEEARPAGEPAEPEAEPAGEEAAEKPSRKKPDSYPLVVLDLAAGAEHRFQDVVAYELSEDGWRLAYTASNKDGSADGVFLVDVSTGERRAVLTGEGEYKGLVLSEDGGQLAFLTDRDDYAADEPEQVLYHSRGGEARRVAWAGKDGLPSGWWVSENGRLAFSENGERLFFGSAPRPAPEPEDEEELLPEEEVELDVWHWQDPYIQPMQLLQAARERRRTYQAVVQLDRRDRVVQLATEALPSVQVGDEGNARFALAETSRPYRTLVGVKSPGYADLWIIDVRTGERRRIVQERQLVRAHLSPGGEYVAWYDAGDRHWHAVEADGDRPVNLTAAIPYPIWDELDDHPMPPYPYGTAGWTEGDDELLVYDRFDIWAVDPDGRAEPRRITDGYGRDRELELRYVELDRDRRAIDPSAPLLLSAFHVPTKQAGFYRHRVTGSAAPERLVFAPKHFGRPVKAENADALLYTREDVAEFPDLWVADASFDGAVKLSEANPQQAEYNWATVELVEWLSADGIPLQGLLYKPEDFDPAKKYPMMVNFYERDSHALYQHAPPLPHRSVIRPTFYASRGYIVFIPDIVYHDGFPGESAMNSVMPGVLKLAAEPWVDEHNVGVQGHSWGGYQIAYMVTQTDFFKAAGAGAPVANMVSAYGGIRWASGMSRQFQYEHTQSRIGGTLWEETARFIDNSPVFYLDRVETPVLIMHNDEDGAVPWEQGIELFMGLRRLDKPAWMIVYNDEVHWPTSEAEKKDWNIRMQQFFDHFLKGAPAPKWLAEGIPATEKGEDLGLDLLEPAGS